MKPASNNLDNKDMIISCRFHTAKLLNKKQPYETCIQELTQQGHDCFMQVPYGQIIK